MSRWDFEISLVLWIASLGGAWLMPVTSMLVAATTFNLWHQRRTAYDAGQEFLTRVRAALGDDLARAEQRIQAVEKVAEDIKESQVKIAGAFRGRNLPL